MKLSYIWKWMFLVAVVVYGYAAQYHEELDTEISAYPSDLHACSSNLSKFLSRKQITILDFFMFNSHDI